MVVTQTKYTMFPPTHNIKMPALRYPNTHRHDACIWCSTYLPPHKSLGPCTYLRIEDAEAVPMDLHDGFPVPILFPRVNLIPNILQIKTVNTALKLQRKSNVLEVWLKKLQYCEFCAKMMKTTTYRWLSGRTRTATFTLLIFNHIHNYQCIIPRAVSFSLLAHRNVSAPLRLSNQG